MPNFVRNKIIFDADGKELEDMFNFIKTDENVFDFNKLIPMPEDLNIESSSVAERSMIICKYIDTGIQSDEFISLCKDLKKESETISQCLSRLQSKKKINLELGLKALDNIEKYDAADWYSWRIKNWNTKWNSNHAKIKDNILIFDTAWSPPLNVIKALSSKFPNISFTYKFAEEDIGSFAGEGRFEGGKALYLNDYDYNEHDTLRLYIECWCESRCIGVNENGKYFKKDCSVCDECDEV